MSKDVELVVKTNREITAAVDAFIVKLDKLITEAQGRVATQLENLVTVKAGKLVSDRKTQRAVRGIDKLLTSEMNEIGYQDLVNAFVAQFGRVGFKSLDNILKATRLPKIKFTKAQIDGFAGQQVSVADNLEGLLRNAAELAKRRATFSIGAISLNDLTSQIASALKTGFANARTIADTSMVMFLRNVHATGYAQVEANGTNLKYRYAGPIDSLVSHALCKKLLADPAAVHTREEISAMQGQLTDVFVSGGGYNCRHWWVIGAVGDRVLKSSAEPLKDFTTGV